MNFGFIGLLGSYASNLYYYKGYILLRVKNFTSKIIFKDPNVTKFISVGRSSNTPGNRDLVEHQKTSLLFNPKERCTFPV